ncbi:ribosomal protein L7/L12 [Leptolyngbya sp. PCC 6406]|uniref:ribosomal protein L7/L12 n=1 Tax=Leptolyngbya sp. PCC 6406 TaxID=1173264 RepID=UPI0002ABF785|nr:ribosomal protein L7/L12 [Leptolyngbya sp. PCC 6406]
MSIGVWILLAIAAFGIGFWLTQVFQNRAAGSPETQTPWSDPELQQRLRQVLANQGRIAAIRLVRQKRGLGLKAAKAFVDTLAADASFPPTDITPDPQAEMDTRALVYQVRELLQNQRKIEAIKQVRTQTGWGLKQSKEFVEKIDRDGPFGPVPDHRA